MTRTTPVALVLLLLLLVITPLAARAADGEAAPLLEQLRTALDPEERAAAASGLAQVQGPEVTRALVAALEDPAPSVRGSAVDALAQRAEAEPGPVGAALERALGDPDPRVQLEAATLLQGKKTLPQWQSTLARRRELLQKHFSSSDPDARRLVLLAFMDAGPTDPAELAFLLPALRDPELSPAVDRILREQGLEGGDLLLREALAMVADPEAQVRALGARELGQISSGAGASREPLEKLLAGDPALAVRVAAAGAHFQLFQEPERVIPTLQAGLQDPEDAVRAEALSVLSTRKLPLEPFTDLLRPNLASENLRSSVLVLLNWGPPGAGALAPDLVKSLGTHGPMDLSITLEVLRQMGPEAVAKALPEIRRLAGSKTPETRLLASVALTNWTGDPGPATRTLGPLLQGKDPDLRSLALQALSELRVPVPGLVDLLVRGLQAGRLPEEAYPALTNLQPFGLVPAALHLRMLKSKDPLVLMMAVGRVTDLPVATPGVARALLAALRSCEGSERFRMASGYFALTRDGASLRPLLEKALSDPDSQTCYQALMLLNEVKDPTLRGKVLELASSFPQAELRLAALQAAVEQGAARSEWVPLALRQMASPTTEDFGVSMLAMTLADVPPATVALYVDPSTLAAITRALQQALRDEAATSSSRPVRAEYWCAILAELGPRATPAGDLLRELARDPDPRIQRAAARALRALGGQA